MNIAYDSQTLNHPNPIARFAHQNRHRKSIFLASSLVSSKAKGIVDYGCGQGEFVRELKSKGFEFAYGYEPFMEQVEDRPYVFKNMMDIPSSAVELVTLFETIEHLGDHELGMFFEFCRHCLATQGTILVSAPVEIGPAVVIKDIVRSLLFRRPFEYKLVELLKCGLFGMSVERSKNIKGSHKGYDFRKSISFIKKNYGDVEILGFGPLPLNTWYGNSQVYFQVKLRRLS